MYSCVTNYIIFLQYYITGTYLYFLKFFFILIITTYHLLSSSVVPLVNVMNVLVIAELIFSAVSVSIDENRLDCRCSGVEVISSTGDIFDWLLSPISYISSKASSLDSTSTKSSCKPSFDFAIFFNLYSYKLSW